MELHFQYSDRIVEIKGYAGLEYKRYSLEKVLQSVRIKSFKKHLSLHTNNESFNYFVLIDSSGKIIPNVYNYLNYHLRSSLYKDREVSLSALKLLYSFLELFFLSDESEINKETISMFTAFLKGGNINGVQLTFRKDSTINCYMSIFRRYYQYLGIHYSIFSDWRLIRTSNFDNTTTHQRYTKKYLVSAPTPKRTTAPRYISYDEYIACIDYIKNRQKDYALNLRDIIIIHLMYEYGLRIGETLGITLEDYFNCKETGKPYGEIRLRNRLTDKPWQFAKGCMKIINQNDYKDPLYHKEGLSGTGYQSLQIELPTTQMIDEYLGETILNAFLSKQLAYNLKYKNLADKVEVRNDIVVNKYIFVSKNFNPITGTAWNRNIREIFEAVGIELDFKVKENNLNHRFRHGFAMRKMFVEGYDKMKLKAALRHTNPHSCDAYINPTEEDMARMMTDRERLLKNGELNLD